MKPVRFNGANIILRAPPGLGDEPTDIPVRAELRHSVSRWLPSAEELAALNRGGTVELWVMARRPPAVRLTAAEPETEDAPATTEGDPP